MTRTVIFALLLAAPATTFAQSLPGPVEDRLEILGEAPVSCVIQSPAAATGINAAFEGGPTSGEIRITELVDLQTAEPRAASISVELPVICNSAHRITVSSANGAMRLAGADGGSAGPFATFKTYEVNATWGDQQYSLASNAGTPLVIGSTGARAGNMSLNVALAAGGQPLVAGAYSDTIVVEFQTAN
jgi:hypothetical protein